MPNSSGKEKRAANARARYDVTRCHFFLQTLQQRGEGQQEIERLREQVWTLQKEKEALEKQLQAVQQEYQAVMHILERARQLSV